VLLRATTTICVEASSSLLSSVTAAGERRERRSVYPLSTSVHLFIASLQKLLEDITSATLVALSKGTAFSSLYTLTPRRQASRHRIPASQQQQRGQRGQLTSPFFFGGSGSRGNI
jgi:hypothetical protein